MADADSPELIAAIERLTSTIEAAGSDTSSPGTAPGSVERELIEARRAGDRERVDQLQKQQRLMGDISNTANLMGSYFGNIADEITGSSAGIENMLKGIGTSIVSATKLVKQFGLLGATIKGIVGIFKGFVKLLTGGFLKVISGVVGFIKDLVIGADEFKKVAAATMGTTQGMAGAFTRLTKAAADTGNSLLKPVDAFKTMRNQLPILGRGATATAERMSLMASRLEILGFSADNQVKNFSILRTTFGATEQEAEMANVAFQQMAERFNMTGDQISQGFQEATQTIGQFGKEVFKSFPKLQAFAKKTGASLNSMLGIINKFNTFEDAAGAVGQLNAVLGGPFLDSIELLQKEDPSEIIGDIVGAFDDAGMDMQKSGRHMRYAVSQILGVSADEAARLLSGGADAFEDATITAEDAAAITAGSVTALIKNSDSAMSRMDILAGQMKKSANSIDSAFGISGTLTNALDNLVKNIVKLVNSIDGFTSTGFPVLEYLANETRQLFGIIKSGFVSIMDFLSPVGDLAKDFVKGYEKLVEPIIQFGSKRDGGVRIRRDDYDPSSFFRSITGYDDPIAVGDSAIEARRRAIRGRANGGPVNSGQPYIVGERGQELFIPGQSGMIQSNETYLTKKEFKEGIDRMVTALAKAGNSKIVMDSRVVGQIVTKEQNRAFIGGYDRG